MIADLLRSSILRGELKPGQRLAEIPLARMIGVSQVSIREGLQLLENQGLVIKHPNRGTYVTEFTTEELAEAVEIRIILESRAALLAHKKMVPEDEERLRALVRKMEKSIQEENLLELEMADMEFHATIWRIANNTPLERALRGLVYPIFAFISLTHLSELKAEPLHELGKVHTNIIDAILSGNPSLIQQAIRANVMFGRIKRYLTESQQNTDAQESVFPDMNASPQVGRATRAQPPRQSQPPQIVHSEQSADRSPRAGQVDRSRDQAM